MLLCFDNINAIATAWVKWIHSPAVSSKSMEVDYSILSFTYFFENKQASMDILSQ